MAVDENKLESRDKKFNLLSKNMYNIKKKYVDIIHCHWRYCWEKEVGCGYKGGCAKQVIYGKTQSQEVKEHFKSLMCNDILVVLHAHKTFCPHKCIMLQAFKFNNVL